MRKATFIKTDAGNYRPVNQRAHVLTDRAVGIAKLRGYADKGANIYVWGGQSHDQLRKSIR